MSDAYDRKTPTGHELDGMRKDIFLSYSDLAREAQVESGQLEKILKHTNQMRGVKIGEVERVADVFDFKFIFFARDPNVRDAHPYPSFRDLITSKAMALDLGPDELAERVGLDKAVLRAVDVENYKHVRIGELFALTSYLNLRIVYHIRPKSPIKRRSAWQERQPSQDWERPDATSGIPPEDVEGLPDFLLDDE